MNRLGRPRAGVIRIKAALALMAFAVATTGCDAIFGLSERYALVEAGDGDGASSTFAGDCARDDAGTSQLSSPGCWASFDTNTVTHAGTSSGFKGVAFDGHFLYLAPDPGSVVVRYDTTQPYAAVAAWTTFDLHLKLGIVPQLTGATFDGRYVTFVPWGQPPDDGEVIRLDTQGAFEDVGSWQRFDPTKVDARAVGFQGATFDGTYLYLVPAQNEVALRFAVGTDFTDASSWERFDLTSVDPTAGSYTGAAFDGTYVYFVPSDDGVVLRFDSHGTFTERTSWSAYDTGAIDPDAGTVNFQGAAFDGAYLYLAPDNDNPAVRYRTSSPFDQAASWADVDLDVFDPNDGLFLGGAFDGRFVYLLPTGTTNGVPNGALYRYDTHGAFATDWTVFDTTTLGLGQFAGSAFDGRFLYAVPESGSKVARFEARSTKVAVKLPAFFGSFF